MEALPRIVVVALGLSLVSCFAAAASGASMAFKNKDCTGETYGLGDYASCVEHVIGAMTTVTPNSPQYDYTIRCPFPVVNVAYGHSKCNPSLTIIDCVTCLSIAKSQIQEKCASFTSVTMELEDCSMKYGPNPI